MSWTDFIKPAAMLVGGYLDYKDRDNRRDELNQAYEAQKAAQMAQYEARLAAGSGGGGGGRNTGAAKAALTEQYDKALALLQPYIDQANKTLPVMSDAYSKGLEGVAPLMQRVLSPEYQNSILTYSPPPEMKLPEHLVGGKR